VSPILVRPVREQLEHDRVIRALQAKLRRKFDVAVNMGTEGAAPVRVGRMLLFPDLVLTPTGRGAKLAGVVEVETAESVNHLEALAQWAHFGRARVPFSLYVPVGSVDMARRLCADNQVSVDEIWTFFAMGQQIRFTLVHKSPASKSDAAGSRARSASARRTSPAARTGARGASGARAGTGVRKPGRARTAKSPSRATAGRPSAARKTAVKKKTAKPARSRKR